MKINRLNFFTFWFVLLSLAPLISLAQVPNPRIYLGASWGAYSIKESNLKDNDRLLKAAVGAQFNPMLGIEGSWTDFNATSNGVNRFDGDGVGLAGVLSFPAGSTSSLFVKAGQFWWNSDSFLGGALGASKGNDPFWGVGFKMGFSDLIAMRIELERYDVSHTNLNTLTAGVEFKF